ncbi:MAG TPA: sigma-70 family RNA polymerase sigma factor [Solirubrobacterales bacterium]|jgi:RNA polymerase sigma factor (sigma-70 family)|nr:sigma-70 family RNA polymerase sigma factor [Solirubrobacterales bacterium]
MPPPAEGFAARFVIGPALRTQPDRRLVSLVREGYENAFEEIVRRYGKALTRYAGAIVGSRAEDVTQDAFSKALLALRREGAEIELRPWLFRIVRNTALNDLRDSPPSADALAEMIAGGAGPAEEMERREELADLMRRLQSLPEAQRAAIVMRELEGLSHEEIANALGLSDGGARQAIYRARRALRDSAGMLLPLPLLKALLAGAAGAPVEAAAGAAGVGGAAGAGVALKAAAATVLVAGAVGAGVAIDHNRPPQRPAQPATGEVVADDSAQIASGAASAGSEDSGGTGLPSGSEQSGTHEPGDDHGDRGQGKGSDKSGDDRGESGNGPGDDGLGGGGENRGPRGSDDSHDSEPGDDHGGGPGPSGHGGSDDNGSGHQSGRSSNGSPGPGSGGSSGSGSPGDAGGSGSSGSESSSSGDGSGPTSGSGTGSSSGSGSGSDGSGSGSGGGGSGSGEESGANEPNFDDPGDSQGGSGFSVQMEPQTEEES